MFFKEEHIEEYYDDYEDEDYEYEKMKGIKERKKSKTLKAVGSDKNLKLGRGKKKYWCTE